MTIGGEGGSLRSCNIYIYIYLYIYIYGALPRSTCFLFLKKYSFSLDKSSVFLRRRVALHLNLRFKMPMPVFPGNTSFFPRRLVTLLLNSRFTGHRPPARPPTAGHRPTATAATGQSPAMPKKVYRRSGGRIFGFAQVSLSPALSRRTAML